MPIHVIALYTARTGESDDVGRHLRSMLGPTRREPGCLGYRLIQSETEPETFAIVETYEDLAALDFHRSTGHFQKHVTEGAWKLITSRQVVIGNELQPLE